MSLIEDNEDYEFEHSKRAAAELKTKWLNDSAKTRENLSIPRSSSHSSFNSASSNRLHQVDVHVPSGIRKTSSKIRGNL